jgi:very-short-patch-repair endonuclease
VAAPTDPLHLDHAIELYLAGESIEQIASDTGVAVSVLGRERRRRGIPTRKELVLPNQEIVSAYQAGESEYSISRRLQVSRNVVRRRLEAADVPVRSMSEAGLVRAAKLTREERERQASAAHATVKGTRQSPEQLLRRAAANESRGQFGSPGEEWLGQQLSVRGVQPVPQKAIGKYNVDLAVHPVAVEVLGGGWHLAKRHHAARTPHILDQGWALLFVWNHEGRSALREGATNYVVTFLDEVRRDPSLIGEYRVIAGDGQLLARGRADDDEFPLVPPPRGRVRSGA